MHNYEEDISDINDKLDAYEEDITDINSSLSTVEEDISEINDWRNSLSISN
jgi:prefoldin subunit 5